MCVTKATLSTPRRRCKQPDLVWRCDSLPEDEIVCNIAHRSVHFGSVEGAVLAAGAGPVPPRTVVTRREGAR
jgi:hypothetical protein